MRSRLLLVLAVCLSFSSPHAFADSVILGVGSDLNGFPFSAGYTGEYQQVYIPTAFPGPVLISAISFFSNVPGAISGNYILSLSTTQSQVDQLFSPYSVNVGPDNTVFYSGTVSHVLTFNGTPFLYDPFKGSLLLDVFTINATDTNGMYSGSFVSDTSRLFNFRGNGPEFAESGGLQTQFTFTSAAVTPEPSTFVLLGTGCAALYGFARRRVTRP